jgi:hypothetical protein
VLRLVTQKLNDALFTAVSMWMNKALKIVISAHLIVV